MNPINLIGLDTPAGYRVIELIEGDLSCLDRQVDTLVVSAFRGGFEPVPNTLLGALHSNLGLDLRELSQRPMLDFRDQLGIWVSEPLPSDRIGRILCVEMLGQSIEVEEIIENVFVGLSILEAKSIPVRSTAMAVLGTGLQGLNAPRVIESLLRAGSAFLRRSATAETLLFVEISSERAQALSASMDALLGRSRVALPREELLQSLRSDIAREIQTSTGLFPDGPVALRAEWLRLLGSDSNRSVEVGVLSRRLLELLLTRLGAQSGKPLYQRIRALEETGTVAPWICGYMQVLRHLGNEGAHESPASGSGRRPPSVESADLALALFCVGRLLSFWNQHCTKQQASE